MPANAGSPGFVFIETPRLADCTLYVRLSSVKMATDSPRPFKVIIAGGSVAGLFLANALERANIDFEVLEKRDVAPDRGQSIFNLPCTNLVLQQLGIDEPIRKIGFPMGVREHWDAKGNLFCSSDELIRLRGP
jgi:2-polyprenyl-6-methoxyphenol hydroxylase-like FAD-dependent oxidoreductase